MLFCYSSICIGNFLPLSKHCIEYVWGCVVMRRCYRSTRRCSKVTRFHFQHTTGNETSIPDISFLFCEVPYSKYDVDLLFPLLKHVKSSFQNLHTKRIDWASCLKQWSRHGHRLSWLWATTASLHILCQWLDSVLPEILIAPSNKGMRTSQPSSQLSPVHCLRSYCSHSTFRQDVVSMCLSR
jgi:hypothetical protein